MGTMSITQFLEHSGTSGKKEYLSGWKSTKEASATVWLHTRSGITLFWRHPLVEVIQKEDKQTGAKWTELAFRRYGCWEDESVLTNQYKRDRETGLREHPPETCGLCRTLEWVREQVNTQRMPWDFPLFHFKAEKGDPSERTLYAAGLYGGFKNANDAQKAELKTKGIYVSEAFKLEIGAKAEYMFVVVDDADPKKGLQIAIESALLGQKMQTAIAKEVKVRGQEEGNPMLHPYAFLWEYFDKEREIQKKYDATAMTKLALTPVVKKLIVDTAPPDVSNILEKFNPRTLLARLQRNIHPEWVQRVPWDELWLPNMAAWDRHEAEKKAAAAQQAGGARPGATGPAPAAAAEGFTLPRTVPQVAMHQPAMAPAAPPPAPVAPAAPRPDETTALAKVLRQGGYTGADLTLPSEDSDEAIACDACGKAIRIDWPKCPHCGHAYPDVLAQQAPPPPPAPRMKTRAEKLAERNAQAPGAPAPVAAPPPAPAAAPASPGAPATADAGFFDDGFGAGAAEDDIPFLTNMTTTGVWWKP